MGLCFVVIAIETHLLPLPMGRITRPSSPLLMLALGMAFTAAAVSVASGSRGLN
jgi:hypothetical protein